ncbi:hypothetical protein POJ06DRAFT_299994 [Lipomyces tetrasporus]|uniref:RNI-like protein n=1 Tax=Lipomyces tetrasporus TaxID=54092 RepID=A0AAD7QVQ9_9ASCO|nr:uncharacterized protein POJ06DRAFT_299994 [Lipomyces tetrasporus]KAJ8102091.1 hypothetical protein POJ06DRAFT_299994 [Lipomyces tetrasporus]
MSRPSISRRSSSRSRSHATPASIAVPYAGAPSFKSHAPARPSPLSMHDQNGMPLEIMDRLRSFPLFASAPDGFLMAITRRLRPQFYSPQDYILTEGEDARAMYWIVRGAVGVTSRDGESVYAELTAGAFFGEIGILFNRPRTASIVARTKCMVVVLTAEALNEVIPQYPDIERAIREEAQERLNILEKQKAAELNKKQDQAATDPTTAASAVPGAPKQMQSAPHRETPFSNLMIRDLLKDLSLFRSLPPDMLHTLALSVEPKRYSPFEYILRQNLPGREIFFIVSGTVEVLDELSQHVKARLTKGAHFGEVTFLSLASARTASVRSVTMVECLVLTSNALKSVMEKYPAILEAIEKTARERMATTETSPPSSSSSSHAPAADSKSLATESDTAAEAEEGELEKPLDPDPYSQAGAHIDSVEENPSALTVPLMSGSPLLSTDSMNRLNLGSSASSESSSALTSSSSSTSSSRSPSPTITTTASVDDDGNTVVKHRRHSARRQASMSADRVYKQHKRARRAGSQLVAGKFPDTILVHILRNLPLRDLVHLQRVCKHWRDLILHSSSILTKLDLTTYNTVIDDVTIKSISAFVGNRPQVIDISNCFHVTDEGFAHLVASIGRDIRIFRMKSVWDVSGMAVMELTVPSIARTLEEVDLSNCRKIGDATLARVVGWVVPESATSLHGAPPPGTIVGCPNLKRVSLSYCKHITDKSMHHLAAHASSRLEVLDLTRCTTITDTGFGYWSARQFPRLTKLCLADCTFLTDKAIVSLAAAAKALEELDLSFCCALSDVSVEVLSLGCPLLKSLNLAFCGSAVSDASLRAVARHLLELRTLSVRGCVRVTNAGVDAVGSGCVNLHTLDISQCRNVNLDAPPLLGMLDSVRIIGSSRSEFDEDRAGGSGKVKTHGYGAAMWRQNVKVIF